MNLPNVKNYTDGCYSGGAAGQAYLKHINTDDYFGSLLQHPIIDAMESYATLSKEEQNGLRGHIVGLCSFISDFMKHRGIASDIVKSIHAVEIKEIIKRSENDFYEKQWDEKGKQQRSESARRAADIRWEKHRKEKLEKEV